MYTVIESAATGLLGAMAAQTSDIFSLFTILLAVAAAAWFALCKKK